MAEQDSQMDCGETSVDTTAPCKTRGLDAASFADGDTTELDSIGSVKVSSSIINSQSENQTGIQCSNAGHPAAEESQDSEFLSVKHRTGGFSSFSISSILHGERESDKTTCGLNDLDTENAHPVSLEINDEAKEPAGPEPHEKVIHADDTSETVSLNSQSVTLQKAAPESVCIQGSRDKSKSCELPTETVDNVRVSGKVASACLQETSEISKNLETDTEGLVHNVPAASNVTHQNLSSEYVCVAYDSYDQALELRQSTVQDSSRVNANFGGEEQQSEDGMIRNSSKSISDSAHCKTPFNKDVTTSSVSSVGNLETTNSVIMEVINQKCENSPSKTTPVKSKAIVSTVSEDNCEHEISQEAVQNIVTAGELQSEHNGDTSNSPGPSSQPAPTVSESYTPAGTISHAVSEPDCENRTLTGIDTNTVSVAISQSCDTSSCQGQSNQPVSTTLPPSTSPHNSDQASESVTAASTPNNSSIVENSSSNSPTLPASTQDLSAVQIKSEPQDKGYDHALAGGRPRLHRAEIAKTANRKGGSTSVIQRGTTSVIQRGKKKIRVTVIRGDWRTPKPGRSISTMGSISTHVKRNVNNDKDRAARQDQGVAAGLDAVVKTEPQEESWKESVSSRVTPKKPTPSKKSSSAPKAAINSLRPSARTTASSSESASSGQIPEEPPSSNPSNMPSSSSHQESMDDASSGSKASAIPTALYRNAHIMVKAEPVDNSYPDAFPMSSSSRCLGAVSSSLFSSRGGGQRGRGRGRGRPAFSDRAAVPDPGHDGGEEIPEESKIRYCSVRLKELPSDILVAGKVNLKTFPQVTEALSCEGVSVHGALRGNRPQNIKVVNPEAYHPIQRRNKLGPRPWTCEICLKTYRTASGKSQHKKIHIGIKEHSCQFCGKAFMYKSTLTAHNRTHTGERPFVCKLCGAGFRWSNHLYNHLSTHSKLRPFKCEQCGKSFSQKGNLSTHLKIHAGIKPHKCSECGSAFGTKYYLLVHMRRHTGEKPYHCKLCSASFAHLHTLTAHMRSHNDERPYKCRLCSAAFRQHSHRNTHMELMHEKPKREGYTPRKQRIPLNLGPKSVVKEIKEANLAAKMAEMHDSSCEDEDWWSATASTATITNSVTPSDLELTLKRKRGRPQKATIGKSDDDIPDMGESNGDFSEKKPKRGRPKKADVSKSNVGSPKKKGKRSRPKQIAVCESGNNFPEKKHKRGRPKQTPIDENASYIPGKKGKVGRPKKIASGENGDDIPGKKRQVGRPKKIDSGENGGDILGKKRQVGRPKKIDSGENGGDILGKKRQVGRPKKIDSGENGGDIPGKKRQVGRPKKIDSGENGDDIPGKKHQVGRPKKIASGENGDDIPGKKRKVGRPKKIDSGENGDDIPGKKRKVGRPKKIDSGENGDDIPGKMRQVGRPKKKAVSNTNSDSDAFIPIKECEGGRPEKEAVSDSDAFIPIKECKGGRPEKEAESERDSDIMMMQKERCEIKNLEEGLEPQTCESMP